MQNFLAWIELHPALAGWFQAIGSVIAIAVAIAIPVADRVRIERAAVRACQIPVHNGIMALAWAHEHFLREKSTHEDKARAFARLKSAASALSAAPLDRLPEQVSIHLHNFLAILEIFETIATPETIPATYRTVQSGLYELKAAVEAAPKLYDADALAEWFKVYDVDNFEPRDTQDIDATTDRPVSTQKD